MSAPVLSLAEQKKALSAKKKKKKAVKNVLGLPSGNSVVPIAITSEDEKKICDILERLLPSAKIPFQNNKKWSKNCEEDEKLPVDPEIIKEAMLKRTQLALGVNDLNRSVKKKGISAVLLASDIHPKFLIHHLNLLCAHNKVPFLHVSNLRGVTKRVLGFPCIALGFRKDFEDFREAVTAIQSLAESKQSEAPKETDSSSDEDDKEEEKPESAKAELNEKPFTYLYRTSTEQRVFIPENYSKNESGIKKDNDFITIGDDDDDDGDDGGGGDCEGKKKKKELNNSLLKGISSNVYANKKTNKTTVSVLCNDSNDDDDDEGDDYDFEVPKKKSKMSWAIDKVGDKKNARYSPANIVKVHPNENRKTKKK